MYSRLSLLSSAITAMAKNNDKSLSNQSEIWKKMIHSADNVVTASTPKKSSRKINSPSD